MTANNSSGASLEIARRIASELRTRPSAVLSDFDGTLSELADTPDGAMIDPAMEQVVHRLADLVDVVGIVTGRAAMDVMSKLDTNRLIVVGNHGLETFIRGEHIEHEAGIGATESVIESMAEIRDRLDRDGLAEGVLFENKRLSGSIHYRQAPNKKQVGSILVPLARRIATRHGLRLTEGKLIVELRPMEEVSKGTAIRQLVEGQGSRSAVFLGDDLTDVDGFEALKALRSDGTIKAVAVGVIGPDSHPRVAEAADVLVRGVDGVSTLLDNLVQELERE